MEEKRSDKRKVKGRRKVKNEKKKNLFLFCFEGIDVLFCSRIFCKDVSEKEKGNFMEKMRILGD